MAYDLKEATGLKEVGNGGDVVVSVKNISKKFCKSLRQSMFHGIIDLSKDLVGIRSDSSRLRKKEFWAVEDVSFELRKGQVLGLIGPNGSGKTTLLRLLSCIFPPDKGEIAIKGRVSALIALGAGFHPHLTGSENIYLNASILGMSRNEIRDKFDRILDFAEIGDFIDSPVSTYSSGMRVRLGFSIAMQIEPNLMLIDEILAVGDAAFKAKCFNAISEICNSSAVILVSHNMAQVARVCTDICVMEDGKTSLITNDVPGGIDYYLSKVGRQESLVAGNGKAAIHRIELESNGAKDVDEINYMEDLVIHLRLSISPEVKNPYVGFVFLNRELQSVAQCSSVLNGVSIHNNGQPMNISVRIPQVNLNPSIYSVTVGITDDSRKQILLTHHNIKYFKVVGNFFGNAPAQFKGEWRVD